MKLLSLWTDAKDRPAVEAALGTVFYLEAALLAAWPLWDHTFHPDPVVLGLILGAGTSLLGLNAVSNMAIDKMNTL